MPKYRKHNPALQAHVWSNRIRKRALDLRQSLAETQASERRFRQAIHFLPIPIGISDLDGRILAYNQMFTEVFGYTLEDIPTVEQWLKLACPNETYCQQSLAAWQEDVALALERGVPTPTRIYQVVCKDGSRRLVEIATQPVGDLIATTFNDVTARNQTENALRESEARYRQLAENISDVVWTADLSFNITYVSPSIQTLTGDTPEKYITLSLEERHPPAAIALFKQVFIEEIQKDSQPGVDKNRTRILEAEHYTNSRAAIWTAIHLSFLRDKQESIIGIMGVTRDITARRLAEEAQRAAESNYRALVEQIPAITYIDEPDGSGRSSFISPQIETMLGVSREAWMQAGAEEWGQMIHPEDRLRVLAAYRRTVEIGQSFDEEYRMFRPDGRLVWVGDHATRLTDANGRVYALHGVMFDITERKRAQESLQWQARFQRLLMDISLTYINLPPAQVSTALDNSLAEIGAFVGADRAYIFDFDFQAGTCSNTHEWCAEGITPYIGQLQAVPLDTAPGMVKAHLQGQSVHIADAQALPPGSAKDLMTGQGIKSLLTVPLMDGAACLGFIGFDSVRQIRSYSNDEQRLLSVFAGLLVNIQRRQRAEESLNQTRSSMAAIIENTLDNIWAVNTKYEIIYTNQVFARTFDAIFGVRLAPGVNILNSLPEAFRSTWKERYDRAFNGERFIFVDDIETGGGLLYVEVAVNPIAHDGQVMGASFFGRDISKRKQAERERDIALAKYQTLFETFPLGISVTDEQGGILETNQTAEKLLAVPKEEHTQRDIDSPVWRIIREDGTPMPPDEFASVRALNERRLVENVRMGILKPDETVTWLNVAASPLLVPGYGVVVTYGDISAQILAEQALRQNNQFVNSLLRAVPVAVFFKDREGRYLGCNDVYTEITGVSAEVLRGKTVHELWPGELSEIYHQKDLDLMRNQEHQTYEFKLRDKDGKTRPVIFAKDVFLDASGEAAGMVGAFLDITERKRMEDQLRIKEWAIAGSINAIALAGLDGNLTFVNPAFLKMWGYESETEVFGRSSVEFWQERDDASNVIAGLQQYGSWRGELLGKRRDGSSFSAEVAASMVTDESGQPLCLLGVFVDITERKRMEDALRENEIIFSSFLEHSPVYVFFKGENTRFLRLSKNYEQMLGMPIQRALGKSMDELFPSELARSMVADDLRILRDGQRVDVVEELAGRVYQTTKFPIFNNDGKPFILAGFTLDITDRVRAEQALRESEARNRAILSAQPDLLFVIGSNLIFLDSIANDPARLLRPPEQVIGYPVDQVLPPYLADLTAEKVHLTLQTGQMQIYDYSLASGSEEMFFESRMTLLNQDSVLALVRDVTEARRTEMALRESEKRFRVLFENAGVGVAQGDTNTGRFLKVNQKYCDILGYTREEMENIEFASITHPDDLPKNLVLLEQLKRGEIREFTLEKRYIRKDGTPVWVLLTVSPLWNPGEAPSTHITVVFDISEQKRAAESLRASEKKYRQLSSLLRLMADTMPDMLWAKNLEREYIFANQAICDQLLNAADTNEPLGKTDLFFALRERAAHPENPQWHTFDEICSDSDAITLQELKPMQFDEYGNVKGQFLYLDVHKSPLYDDDGELLGVVGSARDVTARKQAEVAIKESAERAQLQRNALAQLTLNETIAQSGISEALKEITRIISDVLNVARASVWLLSSDNAELRCLMLRETGQQPQASQDVLRAADFPGYFDALLQESILSASDTYHDLRTREFVGNYLPSFGIGAMLDVSIQKDGRLVGVICAEHIGGARAWHSDESSFLSAVAHFTAQLFAQVERKRAEQALRESEERYRSLFTQMLDGVYRSTRFGKFVEVNPAMVKMFGYDSQEEMLEIDIKAEPRFDPTERDSSLLAEGGRGIEIYRMRRKDGSEIWVEDHGYYVSDEHGNILFYEGILRDVTEKVLAEQRILQLNADLEQRVQDRTAQLEEANRELESFSYSVSHDLRAPLRAIDGFSRMIINEHAGELSLDVRELLERVRAANENMSHLVDALLGLSRMSRASLRREPIDLSPLAREILQNLGREYPERNVEWVVVDQAVADGDFRLLQVVLENLLGNAWKFTSKKEQARIEFGVETLAGETVYFVRDNGAGFDARYASKLFGAFQRLHRSDEFEGTGIGLATVQRIIHRHGGRIWAESELGKGATFYFTLR